MAISTALPVRSREVAPSPLPDIGHVGVRHDHNALPDAMSGTKVAELTYTSPGAQPVLVEARLGNTDHVGHLVEGMLSKAVRIARHEAAIGNDYNAELGAAAVLRGPREGEWLVAPVQGYLPGGDTPVTSLPIDEAAGTSPIFEEMRTAWPARVTPAGIDGAQMAVRAARTEGDLIALVGVNQWIYFADSNLPTPAR